MAKNTIQTPYDDAGFPQEAAFTAQYLYSALPIAVKAGPGRLVKVTVTVTTGGGNITIYDNASTNSGTILLVIPTGATAGTIYDVRLPAVNGIYAYQSAANAGQITIGYS